MSPNIKQEHAFHISLNVADLNAAVNFYTALFGVLPQKHYSDYVKFEVSDPPLVLSLEPSGGGNLNHLGIKVQESRKLRSFYERLAEQGIETQWLSGVDCCYSRQNKIIAQDPDGNIVEVYNVDADLEHQSALNTEV